MCQFNVLELRTGTQLVHYVSIFLMALQCFDDVGLVTEGHPAAVSSHSGLGTLCNLQ